jgi:catalase
MDRMSKQSAWKLFHQQKKLFDLSRNKSEGYGDLALGVWGFAIKYYKEQGNFDIVGNIIPVFWIQFEKEPNWDFITMLRQRWSQTQ